ncbi:MAG: HAD domain-containing protein [Parabacteroides sp.]
MKALFLDIDGVLQSPSSRNRFAHLKEVDDIVKRLNEEKPADEDWQVYTKCGGQYDILAVMFDWDEEAVSFLRNILDTTGAKIVLSTDWRYKGVSMMKALLSIHDLDQYYADSTYFVEDYDIVYGDPDYEKRSKRANENREEYREMRYHLAKAFDKAYPPYDKANGWKKVRVDERAIEIREYLDRHPEITSYVALDDRDLRYGLDDHAVVTRGVLLEEKAKECVEILNREDGPFALPEVCRIPELQAWREKWVGKA